MQQIPLNVPFKDLTQDQRDAVYAWAMSHEWHPLQKPHWGNDGTALYVYAEVASYDVTPGHPPVWETEEVPVETLKELRDWAGY